MWLVVSVILTQVFIFMGLIVIFRRIMTKNVVSATKHIDELNQEYSKREEEASRKLAEATKKAQDIVSKAVDEAQKKKEEIAKQVEKERAEIIKQAHLESDTIIKQADKSREHLLAELEERIAKEAINKACELIQDAVPEKFKLDLHTHWVEDLLQNAFDRLKDLHIPEELYEVKISSAFPLSGDQKKDLAKRLKTLLGRDAKLKEDVDPKIVAGIIVTIGSLVLDGSFRDKIQKQAHGIDVTVKE